ncbi:hypothetical protein PBPRA2588 [Photobacterium profundum SS9]|uniref:Lipoprotein n=2 Tax=Photobacterium profundum TaxID=74109 RepID=Q6LP09_PHOPR|nr:hypothetical protein PBPRA2588 [Photobacterium profundum SS9]
MRALMFLIARISIAAGMLIILSGCSATRHVQLSNLGFTRHYLDGYQDGCNSRKEDLNTYLEGFRRDPERMKVEDKYASGWNDGYEQCYADNAEYH